MTEKFEAFVPKYKPNTVAFVIEKHCFVFIVDFSHIYFDQFSNHRKKKGRGTTKGFDTFSEGIKIHECMHKNYRYCRSFSLFY